MTSTAPLARSGFRLDINGLRAIAVALVVLYHFKVPVLTGGFVGVDCFFVISGYLMTKIIDEGLQSRRFSLLRFYEARAVRIIPALAVLLLAVLAFGYVFLEPGSFTSLGNTAGAAAVFFSDWKFALERGYFNPSSERDWLLHTWSLSVEWQFYLAYPLAYMLLSRVRVLRNHRVAVLLGLAVLSFAANVVAAALGGRLGTFAFFLMPLRAWEMMIGGLVYLAAARLNLSAAGRWLEILGLGLIAAAALVFDRNSLWPSYNALLPTAGAAFLILSDRGERSLLRSGLMQAIGRWSYSIYLWHWPLAVGIVYFGLGWSLPVTLACIAASVLLGWLSFTLVETHARDLFSRPPRHAVRLASWAGVSGVAMLLALGIGWTDGLPGRSRGDMAVGIDAQAAESDWAFPRQCQGIREADDGYCYTREGSPPEVILFGDSHAQMLYPLFAEEGWPAAEFVSNVGCAPIPDLERRERGFNCVPFHRQALEHILASPVKKVIYASIWVPYLDFSHEDGAGLGCLQRGSTCEPTRSREVVSQAFDGLREEVRRLVAAGKEVAIVLPFPAPHRDIPFEVRNVSFRGSGTVEPVRLDARPEVEDLWRDLLETLRSDGAAIIDPRDALCRDGICPVTDATGRTLFIDGNHLRPAVVKTLGALFQPFLNEAGGNMAGQTRGKDG